MDYMLVALIGQGDGRVLPQPSFHMTCWTGFSTDCTTAPHVFSYPGYRCRWQGGENQEMMIMGKEDPNKHPNTILCRHQVFIYVLCSWEDEKFLVL
jgi:hypothetical protein